MNKQRGFAVLEAVLILAVMAAVGFTGYYVWHSSQSSNETAVTNNPSNTSGSSKKTNSTIDAPATVPGTESWLAYTTPDKKFSMRLADGWKLEHCNGSSLLFTYDHKAVSLKTGQIAVVTNVDCGSDGGGDGLFISFYNPTTYRAAHDPLVRTFKTSVGDTVKEYSRVEDTNVDGLGGLERGGTYYTYVISKSSTEAVSVNYGVNPGQSNDHATVEQAIKTIVIN